MISERELRRTAAQIGASVGRYARRPGVHGGMRSAKALRRVGFTRPDRKTVKQLAQ